MGASKPIADQVLARTATEIVGQTARTLLNSCKTLAVLLLLTLTLPINAALVVCALTYQFTRQLMRLGQSRAVAHDAKSVLISGGKMTKALQLARLFHQAGHRVVLTESHAYWLVGHRFSRSVDRFYTLPKAGEANYESELLALVRREKIERGDRRKIDRERSHA